MMQLVNICLFLLVALGCWVPHGVAQTEVTYEFVDGDTASADEVNQNFSDLASAIDGVLNETRSAVDIRTNRAATAAVRVYCEDGEVVLGGGWRYEEDVVDAGAALTAPYSCFPFQPGPKGAPTYGYMCQWETSGVERKVYAICF